MAEHYDLPWKEALDRLLMPFLALFFPAVHGAVDWSEEAENLETELARLSPDSAVANRRADKLFRVRLASGEKRMLLLHIEVQTTFDPALAERILVYWYRIYDHYGERPISLVLLADENPAWRPGLFREELLGFRLELQFPVAKLLDHSPAALRESSNPVALAGVAYFLARATGRHPDRRLELKVELVQVLLHKGFPPELAHQVFRLIDWMMVLPREAEQRFRERIVKLKEDPKMRYVTSFERIVREEGRVEGLSDGVRKGQAALIHRLLELRFGSLSAAQVELLAGAELEQLSRWGERVVTAASLDDVFAAD